LSLSFDVKTVQGYRLTTFTETIKLFRPFEIVIDATIALMAEIIISKLDLAMLATP